MRQPIPERRKRSRGEAGLVIHDDMVVGRQPSATESGRHLLVVYEHEGLLRAASGTQAARHGVERDGAFDVPLAVVLATASVNNHHVFLPQVLVKPPGTHNHAGPDLARVDGKLLGFRYRLRQFTVGNDHLFVRLLLVVEEIRASEEQGTVAVAVVAVGRLPGSPLDVVRRGPLPGGNVAEVGETILAVEVEHLRVGRHVSDQHVPVSGARSLGVVVQPDLEGLHFALVLEKRHPLAVLPHVATIAVDVGLGVTHLALHLADVNGVIPH